MSKKRRNRRKRIVTAYVARVAVALVLVLMIVLMFCGCLYIRDLFQKEDSKGSTPKVEASNKDASNDPEDVPEDESDKNVDLPYKGYTVVLDAGHGGIDCGTMSDDETVMEKDINISIVKKVQALLKAQGVKVKLTRDDDSFPSLDDRVNFANKTSANLYVSLHCNYFEDDDSVDGLEAFYCPNAVGSQQLAENIADAARQRDEIAVRGATENSYYVTKNVKMDAVLIEMGFLSNPTECQKLASSDYQDLLAETIVEGILQTFDNENSETENEESSM